MSKKNGTPFKNRRPTRRELLKSRCQCRCLCRHRIRLRTVRAEHRAGRAQAREGRSQVRLHQADRHGADRDREGTWLSSRTKGCSSPLEPQANWKVLLDRVITGELDGAHMLAGQPLGATIGFGTKAHVITPFSMDLNGNGITVAKSVWEEMKKYVPTGTDGKPVHPIKAEVLKKVVDKLQGGRQALQHGHGVSRSRRTITNFATGSPSGGLNPGFYSPTDISGQIMADVLLIGDAAAADARDARGRHHPRLLRRRAVESASGVQRHRRAGDHRLRNLEEQSGEGVRLYRRFPEEKSQHRAGRDQGAHPRGSVARREQQRQPRRRRCKSSPSRNMSAPMPTSSPIR